MESDAEDTKSQLTQNQDPSTPKHKHKKRKTKKTAVPTIPTFQAAVQVFPEHPEKTPPIVAHFSSGFDPAKNPDPNSTKIGLFRNANRAKRVELVVHPDGTSVDFVGTSYTGAATSDQYCNYALGVLDKATQTLKITPIVSNKIFRLEPKVRGYNYSDKEPASSAMGELTAQEKAEKQMQLHNLYGTKKSIRESKKMQSLKQADGPDSLKDLDAKMKQIVVNKEALESAEAQSSRHIPPFNESATTPQEAYPLDKIIITGEWDDVQDIYNKLQGGNDVKWDAYPNFVLNRIQKLKDIRVEEEKFKLACICTYITHLIKFKDQYTMDGVSSAKGHRIPSNLRNKFLNMFDPAAGSRRQTLSREKTNLLISYVLVLTLHVDEFQTELTDIAKDLRMGEANVKDHYENLGCKLTKQRGKPVATLPVPLKFPQEQRRRKKGKR
ncbi:DNA-directed RNA polymerase I subunit rpa49-like [Malus sylvestris]|uniref:DNA-directed RNA polymerase I subunit rpa49 n=1 Tax=Malus domestica TaxID=3750 RepID=A0A498J3C5_MALDO|nr:DNA-directed RNA polymerase I subunit rpa49-like [Malus sylvestris]RXH88814.1 hypothetical protein DVH24_000413 [Malus domestica]